MELKADWKGYERYFGGRRSSERMPAWIIDQDGIVVDALSAQEDLSSFVGSPVENFQSACGHLGSVRIPLETLEQWQEKTHGLSFIHREEVLQSEFFHFVKNNRDRVHLREKVGDLRSILPLEHYLIKALDGWWGRFLPSNFGIYFYFTQEEGMDEEFVLLFQRGKISRFYSPRAGKERSAKEQLVYLQSLSEQMLLPVQGVEMPLSQWMRWREEVNPWREVSQALREEKLRLFPFRWSVATLVGTKGLLGI